MQFPILMFKVSLGDRTRNKMNHEHHQNITVARLMVHCMNACLTPTLPCKDTHNERLFSTASDGGPCEES